MKRCPLCRHDYRDDGLLYCLYHGTDLLEGPTSLGESATFEDGVPPWGEFGASPPAVFALPTY